MSLRADPLLIQISLIQNDINGHVKFPIVANTGESSLVWATSWNRTRVVDSLYLDEAA
jgi:hypothetical protein